jgi:hypothetical protein
MRKSFRNMVLLILLLIILIWIANRWNKIPSLNNLFTTQPVVIDKTPILIKEIKSIAQLVTITAYDEVVVDSTVVSTASSVINSINALSPVRVLPSISPRLVLIGRGKVLAGTDLKQLKKENFIIEEDTITLRLPRAVIFDAIINPSDFEVFDEKGTWSYKAVTAVKMKAKRKMINRALQKNILGKADAKAKAVMEDFLISAGFEKVNVLIK